MGGLQYDIKGQRSGKLVAVKYLGNGRWDCKCDCGKTTIARGVDIRRGRIKSCGCGRGYRKTAFKGCDMDCFNCPYPDCKRPTNLM